MIKLVCSGAQGQTCVTRDHFVLNGKRGKDFLQMVL